MTSSGESVTMEVTLSVPPFTDEETCDFWEYVATPALKKKIGEKTLGKEGYMKLQKRLKIYDSPLFATFQNRLADYITLFEQLVSVSSGKPSDHDGERLSNTLSHLRSAAESFAKTSHRVAPPLDTEVSKDAEEAASNQDAAPPAKAFFSKTIHELIKQTIHQAKQQQEHGGIAFPGENAAAAFLSSPAAALPLSQSPDLTPRRAAVSPIVSISTENNFISLSSPPISPCDNTLIQNTTKKRKQCEVWPQSEHRLGSQTDQHSPLRTFLLPKENTKINWALSDVSNWSQGEL